MIRDKVAESRQLLTFACNLWLEAREIKIPAGFFVQIERIKLAADKAQDETELRKITDQFLAVTKKLAVKDWKGYESFSGSAHPQGLTPKITPQRAAQHPHPSARPRHKHLKSKSASA